MSRPLHQLRALLDAAVDSEPTRGDLRDECEKQVEMMAARIPLVHRTGKRVPLATVLMEGLRRQERSREEEMLGLEASVYFFYGAGCYPRGDVALLVTAAELRSRPSSEFTPFDSGSLAEPRVQHEHVAWADDPALRRAFREDHAGRGADLEAFATPYVATHFREPLDYVRRTDEPPDFLPYHGLQPANDRRTWTIEARIPEDVPLDADGSLRAILLDGPDTHTRIPDAYAKLVMPVEHGSGDFARAIAAEIERLLEAAP